MGFPFSLFFAWTFEITPEGVKRESSVRREESIAHHTGRKLDFVIIGLLIVGMGYFVYESRFASEKVEVATESVSTTPANTDAVEQEPQGSSIAVLPFVNMSSDEEQEYFSDGISGEILNVLAQIPKLHVTSRSSSFAVKNKEINLSEVARLLGVKNILEGSVRKSGDELRITVQLVAAGSDKHLWSKTFDRTLTVNNIFEI
jgi:TolB-like protein